MADLFQQRPHELEDMFKLSAQTIESLQLPTLDDQFAKHAVEEDDEDTLQRSVKGGILRAEKLLAQDPLEETFDQFFKQNAPARAMLFDGLRATVASTFGLKHKGLREELFETFKQKRQLAVQVQRNAATATLGFEKLDEQIRANKQRAENAQDKLEQKTLNDRTGKLIQAQGLTLRALKLESDIAAGKISNKKKEAETRKLNKDIDLTVDKTPFQFIIRAFDGTPQEKLDEYNKWLKAAAMAKDTPSQVEKFMTDESVAQAVASVEGGIQNLESLPTELELPARAVLYQKRYVKQNAQFRKEIATGMNGINLFKELTSLVRAAKTKAGILDTSSNVRQRLQGLFAKGLSGIGGLELLDKVTASVRTQQAQATGFARAGGEVRVTDADLIRFLGMLPQVSDPESVIQELFDVGINSMLTALNTKVAVLPQMNPPKITHRFPLNKLEDDARKEGMSIIQMLIFAKRTGVVYE